MVFLALLLAAWAIVVYPKAREARWTRPWMSARRYKRSMRLVAPRTESEMRRATRPVDTSTQRTLARRKEVVVFLGTGAAFAALAGALSEASAAWPLCGAFTGLLLLYVAAIVEADRRKVLRRVRARRAARALESRPVEREFAEAV